MLTRLTAVTHQRDGILRQSNKKCYGMYLGAPVKHIYIPYNYIDLEISIITLL